jgi:hypothetical protein
VAGSLDGRARRVRRLEATTEGSDRCPECGNGPDDDRCPCEIMFVGPDDALPDEWCGTCGRALSLTINWGDSGPETL